MDECQDCGAEAEYSCPECGALICGAWLNEEAGSCQQCAEASEDEEEDDDDYDDE